MSSVEDQIANKMLQDLYSEIIDQLNIDSVIPRLHSKHRIMKSELDQLQNIGRNLTDQQRNYVLPSSTVYPGMAMFAFFGNAKDFISLYNYRYPSYTCSLATGSLGNGLPMHIRIPLTRMIDNTDTIANTLFLL